MANFRPIESNIVEFGGSTSFVPVKLYNFTGTLQSWTVTTPAYDASVGTFTVSSGTGSVIRITKTTHGLSSYNIVTISGGTGLAGTYQILNVDANNFELLNTVYTSDTTLLDPTGATYAKVNNSGLIPIYVDTQGGQSLIVVGTNTGTTTSYYFSSPTTGLALDSIKNNYVRIRLRRVGTGSVDLSSAWEGLLEYTLSSVPGTWRSMTLEDPGVLSNTNTWYTLEYNLASSVGYATAGYWGYGTETVDRIRFRFANIIHNSQFEIDYVQIGYKSEATSTSTYIATTLNNSTGTGIRGDVVSSPSSRQLFLKPTTDYDYLTEIASKSTVYSADDDPYWSEANLAVGAPSSGTSVNLITFTNNDLSGTEASPNTWTAISQAVSASAAGIASPIGTYDVYEVKAANTSSVQHFLRKNASSTLFNVGEYLTYSIYVKPAQYYNFTIYVFGGLSSVENTLFNLDPNTGPSIGRGKGTIESVGNGWYKCSVTGIVASASTIGCRIYLANASGVTTFAAANTTDKLYIWGPSLHRAGAWQGNRGDLWEDTNATGVPLKYWNGRAWVDLASVTDKLSKSSTVSQTVSGPIVFNNNLTHTLTSNYELLIDGTTTSGNVVEITTTTTSNNTTVSGFKSNITFTPGGSTTTIYGNSFWVNLDNSAGSLATVINTYIRFASADATTAAITDLFGLYVAGASGYFGSQPTNYTGIFIANPASPLAGSSATYNFRSLSNGTTGKWNVYLEGTANNHMEGNLLLGSDVASVGAEKLQVTGTALVTSTLKVGTTIINSANQANTAWLGTGTANSTTFLRGDGTWQTVTTSSAPSAARTFMLMGA